MGQEAGRGGGIRALGLGFGGSETDLPNYELPPFDGIGANEYIVDVTYPNTVDFISSGRHAVRLGVEHLVSHAECRVSARGSAERRIFPASTMRASALDAATQRWMAAELRGWLKSLRDGRSYVSDGKSHLMDFKVNGHEVGGEIQLGRGSRPHIEVSVAARLDPLPANPSASSP